MTIINDVKKQRELTEAVKKELDSIRNGLTFDEVETIDELKIFISENNIDVRLGNAKNLNKAKAKVSKFLNKTKTEEDI